MDALNAWNVPRRIVTLSLCCLDKVGSTDAVETLLRNCSAVRAADSDALWSNIRSTCNALRDALQHINPVAGENLSSWISAC